MPGKMVGSYSQELSRKTDVWRASFFSVMMVLRVSMLNS